MERRTRIIVGIVLSVLVIINITLGLLYFSSNRQSKELIQTLTDVNKELIQTNALIGDGNTRGAAGNTTKAIEKLNSALLAYLPPKSPVAATAKKDADKAEQSKATQKASTVGVDEVPTALIKGQVGDFVLVVEKTNKLLHLFLFDKEKPILVKSYPCVVGENAGDKQKQGDLATPQGVYFLVAHHGEKSLPELYGAGAFVLNYPSLFDYKQGKKGNGIWLHGHPRNQKLGQDKTSTKGCVVVDNKDFKELSTKIKVGRTPIIITEKISAVKIAQGKQTAQELTDFIGAWRRAWESKDIKKYLSFYSQNFINNDGMNYKTFKSHKEKVNKSKRYIHVDVSDLSIFSVGQPNSFAVARFNQKYRSDNFAVDATKLFYLQKGTGGWKIAGESAY